MLIYGINLEEPSSSSFTIDCLNKSIEVKNLDSILRFGISISSNYVNSYSSLDKTYVNLIINFEIRLDYLDISKELNYKTFNFLDTTNICTNYDEENQFLLSNSNVIDLDVLNTTSKSIDFYIIYMVSL